MVLLEGDLLAVSFTRHSDMGAAYMLRSFFVRSLLCYNIATVRPPPPVGQAGGGRPRAIRSHTIRL